ncbi:MAG: helix-turn-helix domain-containing protein [Lentimicrobium sp.]
MTDLIKALLIIGTSLLLLLALLAFEKALRKGDKSRLYLVVFLVFSAIYYTCYGLSCCAPSPYRELGGTLKIPVALTFIPLFFLFLRDLITGTTQQFKYVIKHLILPAIFIGSTPLLYLLPDTDPSVGIGQYGYNYKYLAGQAVLVIQTIFYTLRMFKRYSRYSGKLQTYYHASVKNTFKIRNLLTAFVIFLLVLDNWLMSFVIPASVFMAVYPLVLLLAALVTGWLGLTIEAYHQPDSVRVDFKPAIQETRFNGEPVLNASSVSAESPISTATPVSPITFIQEPQTSRIPFGDAKKKDIYERMVKYLKEEEPFTNPKLTLKQMASDLDTNTRYLSMVINEVEGCNFNQMLNRYRVNKVIQLLVDNQAESYSYLGLAQKAGFHSKSVFISAFKSQTGSTPSEFSGNMKRLIKS